MFSCTEMLKDYSRGYKISKVYYAIVVDYAFPVKSKKRSMGSLCEPADTIVETSGH